MIGRASKGPSCKARYEHSERAEFPRLDPRLCERKQRKVRFVCICVEWIYWHIGCFLTAVSTVAWSLDNRFYRLYRGLIPWQPSLPYLPWPHPLMLCPASSLIYSALSCFVPCPSPVQHCPNPFILVFQWPSINLSLLLHPYERQCYCGLTRY